MYKSGQIGVAQCCIRAGGKGWLFRNQPVNDIGIDAHMEMTDDSGQSRQLLALQVKSGPSCFKEQKNNYVVFRDINERQYNYWTKNPLPCIIVLYNSETDTCVWEKLTKDTIKPTKKGYRIDVPLDQVFLDDKSNQDLLDYTNLPQHITNYNFLLSQRDFMKAIKAGGEVKLHSTEWVNKSSGRGDTELIISDSDGSVEKYNYPYWFPFTPYSEVFPRLFPWATFSADEDFYEDSDKELWRTYNCHYDKEDGWIIVGESFDEFRGSLDPMRGIDHAGEVAEYMLKMGLNDLGEAFLTVNEYVSQSHPYVKARPE